MQLHEVPQSCESCHGKKHKGYCGFQLNFSYHTLADFCPVTAVCQSLVYTDKDILNEKESNVVFFALLLIFICITNIVLTSYMISTFFSDCHNQIFVIPKGRQEGIILDCSVRRYCSSL